MGIRQRHKHLLHRNLLIYGIRQFIPENGNHKVYISLPVHTSQVSQSAVPEDHIHVRVAFHKTPERFRNHRNRPALLDPHTDSRMAFMQFILHQPVKLSLQLQHFLRPHHVLFPDGSQDKCLAPSRALKQADAQIFFQIADIDTQRRGRDKKLLRCPGKALAARQGTYILLFL